MADPVVLYEERDDIAVITLNRPARLNTLTDQLVQGVADGIDAATASADVRAVVLRGAGRAFTAGYDLQGDPGAEPVGPADRQYRSWSNPYDAPHVEHRPGAWDPVGDLQFMGAATALRIGLVSEVHPADELSSAVEAHARRFATIPANQLALNKLLINQAFENMGLRTTQLLGTLFDGIARHTEEAYRWQEAIAERGFREVIAERDDPWGDYGSASAPGSTGIS